MTLPVKGDVQWFNLHHCKSFSKGWSGSSVVVSLSEWDEGPSIHLHCKKALNELLCLSINGSSDTVFFICGLIGFVLLLYICLSLLTILSPSLRSLDQKCAMQHTKRPTNSMRSLYNTNLLMIARMWVIIKKVWQLPSRSQSRGEYWPILWNLVLCTP